MIDLVLKDIRFAPQNEPPFRLMLTELDGLICHEDFVVALLREMRPAGECHTAFVGEMRAHRAQNDLRIDDELLLCNEERERVLVIDLRMRDADAISLGVEIHELTHHPAFLDYALVIAESYLARDLPVRQDELESSERLTMINWSVVDHRIS